MTTEEIKKGIDQEYTGYAAHVGHYIFSIFRLIGQMEKCIERADALPKAEEKKPELKAVESEKHTA